MELLDHECRAPARKLTDSASPLRIEARATYEIVQIAGDAICDNPVVLASVMQRCLLSAPFEFSLICCVRLPTFALVHLAAHKGIGV